MMNDSVVRELVRAAKRRGIRPEALCALVEIETAGIPFENDNNTPRLLYERHIAYREAQKKGVLNQFVNAGLAIPKWSKATQYKDQGKLGQAHRADHPRPCDRRERGEPFGFLGPGPDHGLPGGRAGLH